MAEKLKEPDVSYTTDENGNTYEVTEFILKDKYKLLRAFDDPNYTQVPNQLLGSWEKDQDDNSVLIPGIMSDMSESELKVCLALCRLTYGFHRLTAGASIGVLEDMTGMSRQGVLNGIQRLTDRGLFSRSFDGRGIGKWSREESYTEDVPSQRSRPRVVNEVDQTSQRSRPNKERIKKEKEERLSSAKTPPPAVPPEHYTVIYYYKDREHVTIVGRSTTGPWSVVCPWCKNQVQINDLDVPVECLCGYHELVVTKTKPELKIYRYSEPVEAYYAIVRARGVRYGSMEDWHTEMDAIDDIQRWRLVVKEYISQTGKNGKPWSPLSIDRMLRYYNEDRMPGTRADHEEEELIDSHKAQYPHSAVVIDENKGPGHWEEQWNEDRTKVKMVWVEDEE